MTRRAVIIIAVCAMVCSVAYARRIAWKANKKPPVSLHLAITLAEAELDKDEVEYFCIGASIAQTFSEGDWALQFSSADGKSMSVSVGSDKKVRKSEHGFIY